ncbi:hypothetical protein KUTeg_016201 [Tegillarca granosa]|uniref:PX domain-containing protein n=1 Tax=Tegillarca granosa TaxID=220873 RepID=A0ABQ9EMP9_TEGGR|nr:hypothetical protein KUTeg_016201 [Tegillarca granosa]
MSIQMCGSSKMILINMNSIFCTEKIIHTTRSEFDNSEYSPLPEKHSLRRLDRFSPEFLRVRQKALQKFLVRIADHPVLSFDKNFQVFLTVKAWLMLNYLLF